MSHTSSRHSSQERRRGESPLWIMWCRDVSHDITPLLTSLLSSEGPNVGGAGGIRDAGMVIRHSADSSIATSLMGEVTVCFNVPCTITQYALHNLGAFFSRMPCSCTPSTGSIVVFWAMFPSVGKVINACIEHGMRDVRGEGGIMEDMWFKMMECIGVGQCSEGVVLLPSCVPVEFFEPCQVFSEVCHPFVGSVEMLYLSSEGRISLTIEHEVNHR